MKRDELDYQMNLHPRGKSGLRYDIRNCSEEQELLVQSEYDMGKHSNLLLPHEGHVEICLPLFVEYDAHQ